MKLTRQHRHSPLKGILIVAGVVVIAGGATAAYYYFHNTDSNKKSSIDYGPASSDQISTGSSTKENSATNPKPDASGSETPSDPTPQQGSSQSIVGVHLTSSNQNGNFYQVRFQVDDNTNDGTCTLTLTQDSQVLTYTANVQALNQTATCQGFNIPIDQAHLTKGSWQLSLQYKSSRLAGQTEGTIQIQ